MISAGSVGPTHRPEPDVDREQVFTIHVVRNSNSLSRAVT